MRRSASAILFIAVLAIAGPAAAADIPDLTGTWKPVQDSFAAARVGSGNAFFGDLPAPAFGKSDEGFTYVIEKQEGRAFYGQGIGPNGKSEAMVGVLRSDNATLLMSGDSGTVDGRLVDGKLDLCWIDTLPKWNAVSCVLLERSGG